MVRVRRKKGLYHNRSSTTSDPKHSQVNTILIQSNGNSCVYLNSKNKLFLVTMETALDGILNNLITKILSIISLVTWCIGVVKWLVMKFNFKIRVALLIVVIWLLQVFFWMSVGDFKPWDFSEENYPISDAISYLIPVYLSFWFVVMYSLVFGYLYLGFIELLKIILTRLNLGFSSYPTQKMIIGKVMKVNESLYWISVPISMGIGALTIIVYLIEGLFY